VIGPYVDLTDLVLEASMWLPRLHSKAITDAEIDYFGLADDIGF
jgi:hypothetical protein